MRQLIAQFLVLALIFGFLGSAFAVAPEGGVKWFWEKDIKWGSHLDINYRPANHDLHQLELDPWITLVASDNWLVFADIRNTLFWQDGRDAWEINVGGGYRRLMGDGDWILGGYAFYDHLESLRKNTFEQGTLGVEFMSTNWDVRANGYIADENQKNTGGVAGQVNLVGNVLGISPAIEQSMSGMDGEVGWRLPFNKEGLLGDTRIYGGDVDITVAGNEISNTESRGINVFTYGNGHETGDTITVSNNEIDTSDSDGIRTFVMYSDDTEVTVSGNEVSNVADDGIDVHFYESGDEDGHVASITGNSIQTASDDGIHVYARYGHDLDLTISGNDVSEVDADGIEVDLYGTGSSYGGEGNSVTITNNSVDDADDDGIDVYVYTDGHYAGHSFDIAGNRISESSETGIDVYVRYSDDAVLEITGNTITDTHDDGIAVEFYDADDGTADISGNRISEAKGDGIQVYLNSGSDDQIITIANNNIRESGGFQTDSQDWDGVDGGNGINVVVYDNSDRNSVEIDNNSVVESDEDGLNVDVRSGSDDTELIVTNNRIDQSGEHGVHIVNDDEVILTGSPINNSVSRSGIADSLVTPPVRYVGTIRINGTDVPIL